MHRPRILSSHAGAETLQLVRRHISQPDVVGFLTQVWNERAVLNALPVAGQAGARVIVQFRPSRISQVLHSTLPQCVSM
jgi:hypothetical protein